MHRIECFGDMCPLPLMKLMQHRNQLDRGETVMLITDHSCSCEAILSYCKKQGIGASVHEPMSGIWEITMLKSADNQR